MSAAEPTVIDCANLDEAIDRHTTQLGYRLDMILPADSPREALMSKDGERVRLVLSPGFSRQTPPEGGTQNEWITGRAGMEYRDLIPDRLGGNVIASHIRLTKGGEVPDYVHYHKVDFQMIYCKRGRIRVVYEDQGPPFWLETGDCVLQPPEIRHHVLECTAGAEVIEVSLPAEHETWVEHDITLPTDVEKPDRDFGGQLFFRYEAANFAEYPGDDEAKPLNIEEHCGKLIEQLLAIDGSSQTSAEISAKYQEYCRTFAETFNQTATIFQRKRFRDDNK